jgi:hypothetical protein
LGIEELRFEEVMLVVIHRQDEDADGWMRPVHLPGRLQPGHARHRDVEDGQVRWCVAECGQGLMPVGRFGNNL